MNLFKDTTFDGMYAEFMQMDQAIPSPWGMPTFEFVDFSDPSEFVVNIKQYQSVTTPNFAGAQVEKYVN